MNIVQIITPKLENLPIINKLLLFNDEDIPYNPVPKPRLFKHCCECTSCDQKIFVRKTREGAACAACSYAES
jgi:hypothetical protein